MASFLISVSFLMMVWSSDLNTMSATPAVSAPGGNCRVSEAKPILNKSMYSGNSRYALVTASENPLTLRESLNIEKDITLKIEHRGCQDIRIDFKLDMNQGAKNNFSLVSRATKILDGLHLDSKSLLTPEQLNAITTKVKSEASKAKDKTDLTVCITGKPDACIADVKVTTTATTVEFHYLARP